MPKKLLLAEDSLTIQKVFSLTFAKSDVTITAVDNGDDAVRLAGEIAPDLVVADVTLPGRDGYAVAAELRGMETTRRIPVLILSGTLVPLDEARFRASGAKGVLFKPFESQDLVEKVENLLREPGEPVPAGKPGETPQGEEPWDFSDVLDEVEEEGGQPLAAAPSAGREGMPPGALLPGGVRTPETVFNEFDVSLDEIDGGGPPSPPPRPVASPAPPVAHIEGGATEDAPAAVTDLSPAMEGMEEIEDIEDMEDVEIPMAPEPSASPEEAAAAGEASPVPAAQEEAALLDAAVKGQFSGRAEEIFRAVASEAVEKVMWEMMDRLTAEFSAKIRESVEAVAWEVIPATAEALIREEIARIRAQSGKLSH